MSKRKTTWPDQWDENERQLADAAMARIGRMADMTYEETRAMFMARCRAVADTVVTADPGGELVGMAGHMLDLRILGRMLGFLHPPVEAESRDTHLGLSLVPPAGGVVRWIPVQTTTASGATVNVPIRDEDRRAIQSAMDQWNAAADAQPASLRPKQVDVFEEDIHEYLILLLSESIQPSIETMQWPAPAEAVAPSNSGPDQFTPTEADRDILQAIADAPTTITQTDIIPRSGRPKGIVSDRIKVLEARDLVHRPHGERKGYALTDAGRNLCATWAQSGH